RVHRPPALLALLALAGALLAGACAPDEAPVPADTGVKRARLPPDAPRLVLFLVVDMGAPAQLQRHRPLFTGGLARLLEESASFTDAHHLHADTDTSAGHATLATGRHPSGHGIVSNWWLDPETGAEVYSAEDDEGVVSPRRLLAETLGDWLGAVPDARVFAASAKDRSAVLLGGHHPEAAYWYDRETGRFTTSPYYTGRHPDAGPVPGEPPAWVDRFHREHPPAERFGAAWEPLPEVAAAAEELGVASLDFGAAGEWYAFPHVLGGMTAAPGEGFYADLYGTPFVDHYLARFAEALLAQEELGADAVTDLLALSFSAPDSVGHRYGPDSLEYADALVRLDGALGELLDAVDRRVGLERTLIVLSADHGVAPAPEIDAARGGPGRRAGAAEALCVQGLEAALEGRFRRAGGLPGSRWLRPGPFFEAAALEARGIERAEAEAAAREHLEACPGVARVWTRSELAGPARPGDPTALLFAHSFHPERSPDFVLQLEEGLLPASPMTAASHGSPYPHDTHVPWLVRGAGIAAREIPGRVGTVDVAPTVAALVGLPVPEGLDGVDRSGALRGEPE
ncbi:MAG TPA: alkaline phosphatase family protein, partial [Thermoanaerobaculia bacterium]